MLCLFTFKFVAMLHSMQDPSSPIRDETCVPFVGRWSLNHWTTREVPSLQSFFSKFSSSKAESVLCLVKWIYQMYYLVFNLHKIGHLA